ncbi:MAG: phosphatidylserine decarboxylase family protein [Ectothiorhodospiraceae bacterium]|nr:phosphatidylserine decarboxylase family protein [Ectothiorhodospiraceae bacterium]
MITPYGVDVARPIIIVCAAIIILSFFIASLAFKVIFLVIGIGLLLFTLNFFRDPERETPADENAVISPADGVVIRIDDVDEEEFLKAPAKKVSIFMSALDVHVNRYPISGRVGYFRYISGKYIAAFDDKASQENERAIIGVEGERFNVLFVQIAGLIARRIVCPIDVGDSATAGKRFGMIRFGSRVDVYVPVGSEVRVSLKERVKAGESILAVVTSSDKA